MQSYASRYVEGSAPTFEVPIHIGVYKAKYHCLVAYERLVVTLDVRYGSLLSSVVGKMPEDMPHFPVFVGNLFYIFYKEIGYTHCHTVVEADASFGVGCGESGHTAHIFGYGDSFGFYFVNKAICKRKVADGIFVSIAVEIIGIGDEVFLEPVVEIHHRCYAVEAETVEAIFFEPKFAVR